ncbi:MAG: ECF transporter S component [Oscillibacter sp.]|jgi:thiamine transporter ThiT|nr:ECF transporter S component [Oscillibacter sp.]
MKTSTAVSASASPRVKRLAFSGVFLALALVLPFLTGQIPQIGSALLPMHLPVLLCGFVCGWPWGLAVGAVAPLLRSVLMGMPPMFPTAAAMAFELAAYGAVSGLLCRILPKKPLSIYASLLGAMLAGRVLWGIVRYFFAGLAGSTFNMAAFWGGAVLSALPGIVLQLALIPLIVLSMQKAGLTFRE